MTAPSIGELIDLELLILRDEEAEERELRSRYREAGQALLKTGIDPDDRAGLLQGLVQRLNPDHTPGRAFASSHRWFRTAMILLGAFLGWGLAIALLTSRDGHPVNVFDVLAVMVGVQLFLLALLLATLLPRQPRLGPVQLLLERLTRRFARGELMKRLLQRRESCRGLERWILIKTTQAFGVAFNLAALAACLYRITFHDVAFGWSTTLQWDAVDFHAIVSAFASPWTWVFPEGCPSPGIVERTRYSHVERLIDADAAGRWWPFLVLSLAFYGLLPRIAAWLFADFRARRIVRRAFLEADAFGRLHEWMTRPLVDFTSGSPRSGALPIPEATGDDGPPLPAEGTACRISVPDGIAIEPGELAKLIHRAFGWIPSEIPDGPLVVIVPAWESPKKSDLRQFRELRAKASAEERIVAALLDEGEGGRWCTPPQATLRRWKRHLGTLGDPLLRVAALGEAP